MVRRHVVLALALCGLLVPRAASAWSFELHREITARAIALLPPEIASFFEAHRDYVVEHSIDPDLWRNAGFTDEPPRHYLDLDAYGEYPFADLPRDFDEAVAKFGQEKVMKYGTIPWRTAEMWERLVKAFTDHGAGTSPYAVENLKFFAAIVSHYSADANVPFHAVLNYDGQLTNQHGVHARFESELYRRYRDRVSFTPERVPPVVAPRDHVFERLLEGTKLVEPILAADLDAIGDGDLYDEAYFDRFFKATQPILERRLSSAVATVAALIAGAWEAAGRPDLTRAPERPLQRKRSTP
jgi:hypothetical protein